MITARWKIDGLYKANAQKVYEEIVTIGETATPAQIVEKAKDESTELHKCFTWDDAIAADKWRLQEARTIVRLLVKVSEDEQDPEPVRLLYKVSKEYDTGYKAVTLILRNDDEYKELLRQAKAELQAFRRKYKTLTELEAIFDEIDKL